MWQFLFVAFKWRSGKRVAVIGSLALHGRRASGPASTFRSNGRGAGVHLRERSLGPIARSLGLQDHSVVRVDNTPGAPQRVDLHDQVASTPMIGDNDLIRHNKRGPFNLRA